MVVHLMLHSLMELPVSFSFFFLIPIQVLPNRTVTIVSKVGCFSPNHHSSSYNTVLL